MVLPLNLATFILVFFSLRALYACQVERGRTPGVIAFVLTTIFTILLTAAT